MHSMKDDLMTEHAHDNDPTFSATEAPVAAAASRLDSAPIQQLIAESLAFLAEHDAGPTPTGQGDELIGQIADRLVALTLLHSDATRDMSLPHEQWLEKTAICDKSFALERRWKQIYTYPNWSAGLLLTPVQVALIYGIRAQAVRNWIAKGTVAAVETADGTKIDPSCIRTTVDQDRKRDDIQDRLHETMSGKRIDFDALFAHDSNDDAPASGPGNSDKSS